MNTITLNKNIAIEYIIQDKFILASQSPRRLELLEQIGIPVTVVPSCVDESTVLTQKPKPYVEELAQLKAADIAGKYPDAWIIAADTIVVVDKQILGKPSSRDDAISMLSKLNNKKHQVYTAFCICHKKRLISVTRTVKTDVFFKELSEEEIQWYADTNEPFDKAGGYGIQGIGSFLVRKINGSYSNVVGLPVCEVFETLMELNHAGY